MTQKTKEAHLKQLPDDAQWLAERQNGIGGSQVAAIIGESPYESALSLYAKLIGVGEELEMSEVMELGHALEGTILDHHSKKTEQELTRFDRAIYIRNDNPVARFSPDALCFKNQKLIEAKNVSYTGDKWGDKDSDQAPPHILLQVQWGLHVLGKDWKVAEIPVFFSGASYGVYHVERDENMIDYLVEEVNKFWEHVVRGRNEEGYVPDFPVDDRKETSKALQQIYGEVRGEMVELPDASEKLVKAISLYPRLALLEKKLKARRLYVKNEIRQAIGHDAGIIYDGTRFKLGRYSVERFDIKGFRKEHPDLAKKFSYTSKQEKLTHKELT